MRVSRQKARQNRDAVLDAAARLFLERGLDGVGIAEITRAVGLTHGGFYGQFPDAKEGLAAEAVTRAFQNTQAVWNELASDKQPADALTAIAGAYLSERHRDHPGQGCPVPALAADAARRGGVVRASFSGGVRDLLDVLSRYTSGPTEVAKRRDAARQLATLAGAVLLARAVDDPELARDILLAADISATVDPDGSGKRVQGDEGSDAKRLRE